MLKKWSLLIAVSIVSASACEDRGVQDPKKFFFENRAYMEQAVTDLRESRITHIQIFDYGSTATLYQSPKDDALHRKLLEFITSNKLLSIGVIRLFEGDERKFKAVTFHVKEINQAFSPLRKVTIVYVVEAQPLDWLFRNSSCEPLAAHFWFVCEWQPA